MNYELTLTCREAASKLMDGSDNPVKENHLADALKKAGAIWRKRKPGWEYYGCKTETTRGKHRFLWSSVIKWAERTGRRVRSA